jgi:hypothetical protein
VQFRCDAVGTLGALRDTPGGGKVARATIARVGVLTYQMPGGPVREYTPPEVLKAAADALANAPVTHHHPPHNASPEGPLVTPGNAGKYRHGHVVAGSVEFDGRELHAELALDTAEVLAAVEAGRREISLGYLRDLSGPPGITPEGEPYDLVRTRIVPNHVAVVDTARAGRRARIKLDSLGNQIPDTEESPTMELAQALARITELEGQLKIKTDAADAVATLQPKLTATEAKLDAANAEVTKLKGEVEALKDPAKLDAAVTARLELLGKARKVVGDSFKADGKTEEQIVREVAETFAKARPSIKLDGKGADYVRGIFEVAVDAAEADPEGHKRLAEIVKPAPKATKTTTDAAQAEPAWKKPLAANRA